MLSFSCIAFNPMVSPEIQALCGATLRGRSRQQKRLPEMKRTIVHAVLY